ncbi:MAG: dTDP-glucose 4,6-dehydratase [Candidatus Omnitrophota bacterium]
MKVLITGGCGFIGSNFVRYMLEKYPEYRLINLDKLTYAGNKDNLKSVEREKNYKFVKGDICDSRLVQKLARECDAIVNFAAETHVDRSITSAESFIRTNIYGTYTLLEAVRTLKLKRYVQISTDEVYGSITSGKFTEDSLIKPNSPYAASKASADLICRSYVVTYKLPIVITRSSNNFGPYQFPEKVIPLFVTNALEDKKLPIYADGMNVRDWLYVKDNCAAIATVLEKGKAGEVYNIGGESELPNIELTKSILRILGKPESLIEFVKDRPGHDKRYAIDCSKMKSLGWSQSRAFEDALRETVNWYRDNRRWWEPLQIKNTCKCSA